MCGIFGMVFHSNAEHHWAKASLLFSNLAVEASVRGTDATGLARVDRDGYVSVYKNCKPSYEVVAFKRWWYPLQNISPATLALLGHTRWGTHGENTTKNAHPHRFTDGVVHKLVGTHNGIIRNHHKLGPEPLYENDSANLFWRLAQTPRANWGDVLSYVEGSYALAFSTPGQIHFARNLGSPCEWFYCEQLDATVYASTEEILQKAFKVSGLPMDGRPVYLPAGQLKTFEADNKFPQTEVYEQPLYGRWHRRRGGRTNWVRGSQPTLISTLLSRKARTTLRYAMSPDAKVVCDMCNATVQWKYVYAPEDRDIYLCADCTAREVDGGVVTDESPVAVVDTDITVCEDCGKEVIYGECMYDEKAKGWVCSACLTGFPVSPKAIQEPSAKVITLECANCGYEEAASTASNAKITFVQSCNEFLCYDCLEDPTVPFCSPTA